MATLKEIAINITALPSLVVRLLSTGVFDKNTTLWFKGGIAREALIWHCATLKGEQREMAEPRDVDLIVEGELCEDDVAALEDVIGGSFDIMAHSVEQHLSHCDFTINEAVLRNGVLVCTEEAFEAAMSKRIEAASIQVQWMEEAREDDWNGEVAIEFTLATRAAYFAARYGFTAEKSWIYDTGCDVNDIDCWRLYQQAKKADGFGKDVLRKYLDTLETLCPKSYDAAMRMYGNVARGSQDEVTQAIMSYFCIWSPEREWEFEDQQREDQERDAQEGEDCQEQPL